MHNKRSIPEIRERLFELSEKHQLPELSQLAKEMYRNSPVKRAPVKSPKMTPVLATKIRSYASKHPVMHQNEIASKFKVNPGRVSEALNNAM